MAPNEDDDCCIPATQPVMSVLLDGIVAYVEVRSGHDNRSRGVKAHLRKLGATVEDKFTKKVTHVVFNEGLPSTYKKAKARNCHLVSVLWIEACKEKMGKVSEVGYPPIGNEVYENPNLLKHYKKLKSMQPDFDEDLDNLKPLKVRKSRKKHVISPTIASDIDQIPAETVKSCEKTSKKAEANSVKASASKGRKRGENTKGGKKTTALQEITPDFVNKVALSNDNEEYVGHASTSNVPTLNRTRSSSQESDNSSSSVIYCGVVDAGSSTKPGRKKKVEKKNITRADFIEGLSGIVESLSKENNLMTVEVSPPSKGPGGLNLKQHKSQVKTALPRRSPRHTMGAPLLSKQSVRKHQNVKNCEPVNTPKSPACASACKAFRQKFKKPETVPLSPRDDFMIFSQEPGDMPSIDELAKQNRVSINVGGERMTLAEIVAAYESVAAGPSKSSSQSSDSTLSFVSCQPQNEVDNIAPASFVSHAEHQECDESLKSFEKNLTDAESLKQCETRSDAGSSVSSFSTSVLVNGTLPVHHSTLASINSLASTEMPPQKDNLNYSPAEVVKREPSPIFVIKKAKFRRPVKKRQDVVKPTLSSTDKGSDKEADMNQVDSNETTSKQRRSSLNPIDYINRLLPRFISSGKTPSPADSEQVLVKETPYICASNIAPDDTVIPPTPIQNFGQAERSENTASPNSSLTNSVISWVKKSCKVPLFSSRSATAQQTSREASPSVPVDITAGNSGSNTSPELEAPTEDSSKKGQMFLDRTPVNHTSKRSKKLKADSETNTLQTQISTRKRQMDVSAQPTKRKLLRNLNCENKEEEIDPSSQGAAEVGKGTSNKRRKQPKLIVTVVRDDDEQGSSKKPNSKPLPVVLLQRSDDARSSGYDTSHSNESKNDKEKSCSSSQSTVFKPEKKHLNQSLSPIHPLPKKKSESFESEKSSGAQSLLPKRALNDETRRKRTQPIPSSNSKRPKRSNSLQRSSSFETKSTRVSRVDSKKVTESQSFDDSKPSGRKSSEDAKKRLAHSLTRDIPKVIVCTFLTASEQNGIEAAGGFLKGWKLEEKVTARTTHVINSGPKRTLNMLKGMVRGCWLVDQKWMLDSSKAGSWLDEEKYELVEFSPAVKQCRMRRQVVGKDFKHTLFARAGAIFVSPATEGPPAKDIRELLELCGAQVKTSAVDAKIVVGENLSQIGKCKCVQPKWVLDSITKNRILPVTDAQYQIK